MQTYCVEYTVYEDLDGITPAPPFSAVGSGEPDEATPDADGIYRFQVRKLGFIAPQIPMPLSSSVPGQLANVCGDRFIQAIDIIAPGSPGIAFGIIPVIANTPGNFQLILIAGETYDSDDCYFVPQGNQLFFSSSNPITAPALVRVKWAVAETGAEYARMLAWCCCDPFTACHGPLVSSVSPSSITCDGSNHPLVIRGRGFEPGVIMTFTPQCGGGTVTPSNVEVISDSEIHVDIACDFTESCCVDLEICALNIQEAAFSCCTVVTCAFTVEPIA